MNARSISGAALAAVLFFAVWLPAGAAPRRTIQASDYRTLVALRSPAISPDGTRAVVLVGRIDWKNDRRNVTLVSIDLRTHAQRVLTYHRTGLSGPAFSPDGTRLAFLADAGAGKAAKAQVFVMPLDGGDARPVTAAKAGVEQFAWRPDGKAIAYVAKQALPKRKGAARFRDSFVFTTEPIVARSAPQPAHLFVIASTGGRAEQLTFGTRSITTGEVESTLAWSPDGKRIAFVTAPDDILNDAVSSRVAVVDVATKQVRYPTGRDAWEDTPLWSPDGTHFAYRWSQGDSQVTLQQIYVTPGSGAGTALSAPIDRPIYDAAWSPDSKAMFLVAPQRTRIALFSMPLGGRPQPIDLGDLAIGSSLDGAIARNGAMVFVASAAKQPPELYYRAPSGTVTKLTDYNARIAGLDLAAVRRITFPTGTGVTGDGLLVTPPGVVAGKRYPLVVFIHGGPTSSSAQSFSFWAQVMAAHGWLVLEPNYRGSDDLGLKYQRAVLDDPDDGPGKDIMAAVNAVRARGIVDDTRIAVGGWSYGGIMTAWMISKYHIWKAAVSGASVDDWITDYGTADDSQADVDLFHGSPFVGDNATEWRAASAISYVKDVTTPVLILSDVGDNRDSFATSSMYWRALRDNHKDATLRVWPIYGHFPGDPVRITDVYKYWIDFIAAHFK